MSWPQQSVQQVILNLVRTSRLHGAGVGSRARPDGESESCDQDGILLSVEDSGRGSTRKTSTAIFESFYTTKSDGMGMGLSICDRSSSA